MLKQSKGQNEKKNINGWCYFAGIQLFSDVINMEQALLKSEVEEKRENMWVERLSSERKEEASCEEKDPPPPSSAVAAEYENPPKTEAEAIFRLLDVNRQGFVTRKVTRVFRSDALKH